MAILPPPAPAPPRPEMPVAPPLPPLADKVPIPSRVLASKKIEPPDPPPPASLLA